MSDDDRTPNTPEVDSWLSQTNLLTNAAIDLAGLTTIDYNLAVMMRRVTAAAEVFLTALRRLPPSGPAPMPPPPTYPNGATGPTGPGS